MRLASRCARRARAVHTGTRLVRVSTVHESRGVREGGIEGLKGPLSCGVIRPLPTRPEPKWPIHGILLRMTESTSWEYTRRRETAHDWAPSRPFGRARA